MTMSTSETTNTIVVYVANIVFCCAHISFSNFKSEYFHFHVNNDSVYEKGKKRYYYLLLQ